MDRPEAAKQSTHVLRGEAGWEPIEHDGTLHNTAHSAVKCNAYMASVNYKEYFFFEGLKNTSRAAAGFYQ